MKKGFTHDNVDNKSVDWYTPEWIFQRLGLSFDLDPCAPTGGVPWIPATNHYDIAADGLTSPWNGKVWLNPPYGKHTGDWLAKMHTHRDGIALVFARTDTKWFHEYVAKGSAILFMQGRVKFVDGLGVTAGNGAGAGSMLVAWGEENVEGLRRFRELEGGLLSHLGGLTNDN
jgi:hypothetical protein